MGTFVGHFVPGLAFTFVGLWHTICTIKCYKLKGPSQFTSTTWFRINTRNHFIKHLELYLLFTFSIVVITLQLINHPFQALNYEQASMYLHLLLLHFHSADHVGLEGHYHWLLQLIVAASVVATFLSGISSNSFPAAIVRSGCVILQGWWFMVMGFALWMPKLLPKGCHAENGEVACDSEEITKRAMAVANLEFSWAVAGVWVVVAFLTLRLNWKLEYRQLQGPTVRESDGLKLVNRLDNGVGVCFSHGINLQYMPAPFPTISFKGRSAHVRNRIHLDASTARVSSSKLDFNHDDIRANIFQVCLILRSY
ncbi:transmembrane epididymal protein (DUF716) [Rhynchospora pubera]|uniref:Transmembrane epididymal protein (DUF716) n=1 Tax=Rhynchospora pubera TaxID=906938 RepID=A0AAV8EB83_9POAL|nr:transmembrane epididymal protein (DUF716) [Rhynchospora pubera]